MHLRTTLLLLVSPLIAGCISRANEAPLYSVAAVNVIGVSIPFIDPQARGKLLFDDPVVAVEIMGMTVDGAPAEDLGEIPLLSATGGTTSIERTEQRVYLLPIEQDNERGDFFIWHQAPHEVGWRQLRFFAFKRASIRYRIKRGDGTYSETHQMEMRVGQ